MSTNTYIGSHHSLAILVISSCQYRVEAILFNSSRRKIHLPPRIGIDWIQQITDLQKHVQFHYRYNIFNARYKKRIQWLTIELLEKIALAVHARQGILFMADDDGFVYELSLKFKSDVLNRWHVGKEIVHVRGLSVDWLFDRLYLLLENAEGTSWLISRCKLDGREPTHVVTDIANKPSHFEVDPFNGYIVHSHSLF